MTLHTSPIPVASPAARSARPGLARRTLLAACVAIAAATATSAWAADTPAADVLEGGLVGTWVGALEYRDYQSDRRFQLPMRTRLELGADGATFTRVSTFDDGPQTGLVHISTVSLYDPGGSTVSSATFRKGRAVELTTEQVRVAAWQSPTQWTLVHQRMGDDGGKPAELRTTQARQGGELVALKEVRPVGAADSAWVFRNRTVLRLQP